MEYPGFFQQLFNSLYETFPYVVAAIIASLFLAKFPMRSKGLAVCFACYLVVIAIFCGLASLAVDLGRLPDPKSALLMNIQGCFYLASIPTLCVGIFCLWKEKKRAKPYLNAGILFTTVVSLIGLIRLTVQGYSDMSEVKSTISVCLFSLILFFRLKKF